MLLVERRPPILFRRRPSERKTLKLPALWCTGRIPWALPIIGDSIAGLPLSKSYRSFEPRTRPTSATIHCTVKRNVTKFLEPLIQTSKTKIQIFPMHFKVCGFGKVFLPISSSHRKRSHAPHDCASESNIKSFALADEVDRQRGLHIAL